MKLNIGSVESNGAKHPLRSIRGIIKSSFAHRTKTSVLEVNEETAVTDDLVAPILEEAGEVLDLWIPMRKKPRHGWKIATLVGYIFEEQDTFSPRT